MENEITKAPYDWEAGNTNQGDEPQLPVEPINGGIRDERFEPTTMDRITEKVENARKVAIVTPYFLSFIWDAVMGNIFKNWKTTLGALIALGVQVLPQLGVIDQNVATAISTIAVALGLIAAKDSNVTGGTKQQ